MRQRADFANHVRAASREGRAQQVLLLGDALLEFWVAVFVRLFVHRKTLPFWCHAPGRFQTRDAGVFVCARTIPGEGQETANATLTYSNAV